MIRIEFETKLRKDYTKASMIVEYEPESFAVKKVILTHYEFGTMLIDDDVKEVHRWESEEEAQAGSYLNMRYPSVLQNGIVEDLSFEQAFLNEVEKEISSAAENESAGDLLSIIRKIKKGDTPLVMDRAD